MKWLDKIPLSTFLIIALSLGLAPFIPEPHVWEKLKMLFAGTLHGWVDTGDLLMHGAPWLLLFLKLVNNLREQTRVK